MIGKSALNSIQVTLILIFFSKKIIKLEKSPIKYVCLFCKKTVLMYEYFVYYNMV